MTKLCATLIYLFTVCVCPCPDMEVKGQLAEAGSLLPTYRFQLSSCDQAPLPQPHLRSLDSLCICASCQRGRKWNSKRSGRVQIHIDYLKYSLILQNKNSSCLPFFSCCLDTAPWQKQLKAQRVYSGPQLRVQFTMAVYAWQQELEVAGHIRSTDRKQRAMKNCTQLTSYTSLYVQVPSPRNGATHSGRGFFPWLTKWR